MEEEEEEEEKPLSRWSMLRLCAPGMAPQIGWGIAESLLIPYFLSVGITKVQTNILFIGCPCITLLLHPIVGHCSDHLSWSWGPRRPFMLLFAIFVICGLTVVVFAKSFIPSNISLPSDLDVDSLDQSDPSNTVPPTPSLVVVFVLLAGAILVDVASDLLTMPTRALLNDILPESQFAKGNAYYATMSQLGLLTALLICLVPLEKYPPISLISHRHLTAVFVAAVVLMCLVVFLGLGIRESGPIVSEYSKSKFRHGSKPLLAVDDYDDEEALESGSQRKSELESDIEVDDEEPSLMDVIHVFRNIPSELRAIWCAQFFWWFALLQLSFWWTTWVGMDVFDGDPSVEADPKFERGVRWGIAGMVLHSVVAFIAGNFLDRFNSHFGVVKVYHLAAMTYGLATMTLWWVRSPLAALLFMAFTGLQRPVLETNAFILIDVVARFQEEPGSTAHPISTATAAPAATAVATGFTSAVADHQPQPRQVRANSNSRGSGSLSPAGRNSRSRFGSRKSSLRNSIDENEEIAAAVENKAESSVPTTLAVPITSPLSAPRNQSPARRRRSLKSQDVDQSRVSLDESNIKQLTSENPVIQSPNQIQSQSQSQNSGNQNHNQNVAHSNSASEEKVDVQLQQVAAEVAAEYYYDPEACRGVLTALMNMSMTAAQILGGLYSLLGVKYLPNLSMLFLFAGALTLGSHLVMSLFSLTTVPEDVEEDETVIEPSEAEEEEATVAAAAAAAVPKVVPKVVEEEEDDDDRRRAKAIYERAANAAAEVARWKMAEKDRQQRARARESNTRRKWRLPRPDRNRSDMSGTDVSDNEGYGTDRGHLRHRRRIPGYESTPPRLDLSGPVFIRSRSDGKANEESHFAAGAYSEGEYGSFQDRRRNKHHPPPSHHQVAGSSSNTSSRRTRSRSKGRTQAWGIRALADYTTAYHGMAGRYDGTDQATAELRRRKESRKGVKSKRFSTP